MGCFLACFGFKKQKKKKPRHRKPRIISSSSSNNQESNLSYVPLDSDVSGKLDTIGNLMASDSQPKEKPKEAPRLKVKKKVSFNLNVKAYEPVVYREDEMSSYLSEGEEETKWELNTEELSSSFQSFPANYRYQNCQESYDDDSEDQELDWEKELNFDDIVEDDDEDCSYGSDEEENIEERSEEQLLVTQNKSDQYACSVLKPVENLSQWKAIKAKPAQPKQDKENIALEQRETMTLSNTKVSASFAFRNTRNSNSVDASLSNWLDSMETKRTTIGSC